MYDNKFFSPLFFVAVFGSGIRDPGSGWVKIRIRDPQHCKFNIILYRERVEELESELVRTQRSAGLPVRLPTRILLSPPELLKKQPVNMLSFLVVRASDCQCTNCNGPGFDPSIRRHSGGI
jgi:hypothetical protein